MHVSLNVTHTVEIHDASAIRAFGLVMTLTPAPVAQWARPLLKGHNACWPDGLRTLADLGTNPGLEGGFQLDWLGGHAMRLNFSDRQSACVLFKL